MNRWCNVGAFASSGLEKVRLPETLRVIGKFAFHDCTFLKRAKLPGKLIEIAKSAFHMSGLQSVEVPRSVVVLAESAFQNCTNLKTVSFQRGCALTRLGPFCFAESALRSVHLPSSLEKIDHAFCGCKDLESVKLEEALVEIGGECFQGCGIKRLSVPRSVRTIRGHAFDGCASLQKVTFASGSSLKEVGSGAFRGTLVKRGTIAFPAGTAVAPDAFDGAV